MALRPEYSLGHSQYNDFLFAPIGEEETGNAHGAVGVNAARLRPAPVGRAVGRDATQCRYPVIHRDRRPPYPRRLDGIG